VLLLPHGELPHLLKTYGYGAIGGLVALESMGIPLPGETVLVAAALLAGTKHVLNVWFVIAAAAAGAILGGNVGFWLGREFGYRLLARYGRYISATVPRIKLGQYLFLRYGGWVVFFGRFVAILRALAAFLAGTNCMDWPRFLVFNAAGSIVWTTIYGLGAYYFGQEISHLAEPIGVGLGILALICVIGSTWFLRRHEAELEKRAEAALPGPLQPVRRRSARPASPCSRAPE
jgi:membrane protein DedA with SNARE-associated domain